MLSMVALAVLPIRVCRAKVRRAVVPHLVLSAFRYAIMCAGHDVRLILGPLCPVFIKRKCPPASAHLEVQYQHLRAAWVCPHVRSLSTSVASLMIIARILLEVRHKVRVDDLLVDGLRAVVESCTARSIEQVVDVLRELHAVQQVLRVRFQSQGLDRLRDSLLHMQEDAALWSACASESDGVMKMHTLLNGSGRYPGSGKLPSTRFVAMVEGSPLGPSRRPQQWSDWTSLVGASGTAKARLAFFKEAKSVHVIRWTCWRRCMWRS